MTTTDIIDLLILIVAASAFILSIIELRSYKQKENNKLLSQLNNRYLENHNVQAVVKYLRVNDPTDKKPTAYQIDLFLRFFEELGVYLRHNKQVALDFYVFFNFYYKQLNETKRGQELLEIVGDEYKDLEYLDDYKKCMEKAKKLYNKKYN